MKHTLTFRITVVDAPTGVVFAAQRGRDGHVPPVQRNGSDLVFEVPLVVSEDGRITGEFSQGPASGRFVYIGSGTLAGDGGSSWTRRAKIHLSSIAPQLLQAAIQRPDQVLATAIAGRAKDGGPCCASVPLLYPWNLEVR